VRALPYAGALEHDEERAVLLEAATDIDNGVNAGRLPETSATEIKVLFPTGAPHGE
jgi:hypothetical protein